MTATQLKYPSGKYTINPVPRGIWLLIAVPLILFLLYAAVVGYPLMATPETLMGFPLPSGTTNIQMEVQPKLFGEYDAYLRFEIPPDAVDAFLSEAHFQMQRPASDAFSVFANAIFGQTPAADVVAASQPDWWQPEASTDNEFTLAYRSSISPEQKYAGSDFGWYIIDQSDPSRAVVYVFVREV